MIRHFLPGAVLRLTAGVVASPVTAALVPAVGRPPRIRAGRVAARFAAVDLPAVAAGTQVEDGEAAIAADLAEAVVVIAHELPWRPAIRTLPGLEVEEMSRRMKPGKAEKRRRKQGPRERNQTIDVIVDTAARFTCSTEVAKDFADQCSSALDTLDCDVAFNRVAHEMWCERPGHGQQIADALAALLAERERHAQALTQLQERFTALRDLGPQHEHLEPVEKYRELIRARVFPDHPPLT